MSRVPTWRDLRASLPDGLAEETVELIRRATAPARVEARVQAAIIAALVATEDAVPKGVTRSYPRSQRTLEDGLTALTQYAGGLQGRLEDMGRTEAGVAHLRRAAALCTLGTHGTCGPLDRGGDNSSTARPTAFQGCGKGRRFATDGGAWTAAIREAESRLCSAYEPTPTTMVELVVGYLPDADARFAASWLRDQIILAIQYHTSGSWDAERSSARVQECDAALRVVREHDQRHLVVSEVQS